MRRNQARNIALCGFHGCGKTSTGWALARQMRRQFVDVPQEVSRRARMAQMRAPFWQRFPAVDELEPRLVKDLAQRRDLVVALGADSLDDPEAQEETLEFSYTVFIDPPLEVLLTRMRQMPGHREQLLEVGERSMAERWQTLRAQYENCDLQLQAIYPPERLAALILHCFYT